MPNSFDISRFQKREEPKGQYGRQIRRLEKQNREVDRIKEAVLDAIANLQGGEERRSFVIYGEPQSGKTEMMICLTAKLLDEGYTTIIHLLNDSVDLLGQNLGRFKSSGLAPAARNFSEILDPAIEIRDQRHVIFCKKNGSDLRRLSEKIGRLDRLLIIDDEADYASPNAKVNAAGQAKSKINELITKILGRKGNYIGVTATPARLDLNNTFDNDNKLWVNFLPHSKYTGQDDFFPLENQDLKYRLTLLPDAGDHVKYAREALFGFLVSVAYLNLKVNAAEVNYSMLVHTSGKKADHKTDWGVMHEALNTLTVGKGKNYEKYVKSVWDLAKSRHDDLDPDETTRYVLDNISRHSIVILNSERDWKDNSGAATNPTTLFTIIIGGNIVSRGVTLENLLSMFFTRDVRHKIQQDTYIQRARMFGSRGPYLKFFELTIPSALYTDWHRCFVFHRLALEAIKEGLGSLVWIGDHRIAPVANSSIDRSTVNLDAGEMSFGLFNYENQIATICSGPGTSLEKVRALASHLGEQALPKYLQKFIEKMSQGDSARVFVHAPTNIERYADSEGLNKELVTRRRGFIGTTQMRKAPATVQHHVIVFHNGESKARVFYKFGGAVQFMTNTRQ